MAGASDISAGRAFVQLILQRKGFDEGLESAKARLGQFAQQSRTFGVATHAAGMHAAAGMGAVATSTTTAARQVQRVPELGSTLSTFGGRLVYMGRGASFVGRTFQGAFLGLRNAVTGLGAVAAAPLHIFGRLATNIPKIGRIVGGASELMGRGLSGAASLMASPFNRIGGMFGKLAGFGASMRSTGWKARIAGWIMPKVPLGSAGGAVGAAMGAVPVAAGAAGAAGGVGSAVTQQAGQASIVARSVAAVASPATRATGIVHALGNAAHSAGAAIRGLGFRLMGAGAAIGVLAAPVAFLTARFGAMAKAQESGTDRGLSDRQVQIGLQIANSWTRIKTEAGNALDQITAKFGEIAGAQLSGQIDNVLAVVGAIKSGADAALKWADANPQLTSTIISAMGAVAGLSAAVVSAGGALTVAGTVIASLGSVLAVVTNLWLLLGLAIAGATYYLVRFTDAGRSAASALANAFGPVAATIGKTLGGIKDALIGGDLELAAKIAATGVKLAFLDIAAAVASLLPESWGKVGEDIKRLAVDVVKGDWTKLTGDLQSLWDSLCNGVVGAMSKAAKAVGNIWNWAIGAIAKAMLDLAKGDSIVGKALRLIPGIKEGLQAEADNPALRAKSAELMNRQRQYELERANRLITEPTRFDEQDARSLGYQDTAEARAGGRDEFVKRAKELKARMEKELQQGVVDGIDATANGAIDQIVSDWNKPTGTPPPKPETGNEDLAGLLGITPGKPAAPTTPFDAERARLQKELDDLRGMAAKKAKDAKDAEATGTTATAGGSSATFSGSIAALLGGGGPAQRQLRAAEKTAEQVKRQSQLTEKLLAVEEGTYKMLSGGIVK